MCVHWKMGQYTGIGANWRRNPRNRHDPAPPMTDAFRTAAHSANVEPTRRQWRRFRAGRGLAYRAAHPLAAIRPV